MLDELRYRWLLRKHLKERFALSEAYEEIPDDHEPTDDDEPRVKYMVGKELGIHERALDQFRSEYLVRQAYKFHVPLPEDAESWMQPRGTRKQYLTAAAAQKLRADIRAEQKADWEYWANRVTLALALTGSIFGVLAFFKK
ncbi:hypothetical protein ABID59_001275 [Bradyrhizobium sp. S3.3.6]|uniref:hypothetical protein n=1 Tax=Bradyrhizobium sp. S3.3.6 TaxID=3156429 RepID=UPI0033964A12